MNLVHELLLTSPPSLAVLPALDKPLLGKNW
jgi:hypothetical protein